MKIIPLTAIEVRTRQRKSIAPGPLRELTESILGRGLLQPPVCWFDETTHTEVLTVGERRLRAIQAIAASGRTFSCNGQTIQAGFIPILTLAEFLDTAGRFEAELDENIHREDLPWPDRARALADLHAMRSTSNPKQTLLDTGKELVTRGAFVHPVAASQHVRQAEIVAKHFDNPKILNARNVGEAYGLVLKLEEEKIRAAMARKDIASGRGLADLEVRLADLVLELPKLDANTFDLILADPPYGIDAASAGFRSRTVHHHNYTDDVQTARHLAQTIISEGFRVCKPRANLFLFTDIKHWEWLQQHSAAAGWTPFRRPLIWGKSDTEGFAPWGSQGPRITTEFIFFATKGQKGLIASPTDYLRVNRVSRSERLHAAEKPVELLRKLIECSTQPNDFILDPCCGSGSTLVAAKESRRRALGIERDHDYHTTALANLYNTTKDEQVELPI